MMWHELGNYGCDYHGNCLFCNVFIRHFKELLFFLTGIKNCKNFTLRFSFQPPQKKLFFIIKIFSAKVAIKEKIVGLHESDYGCVSWKWAIHKYFISISSTSNSKKKLCDLRQWTKEYMSTLHWYIIRTVFFFIRTRDGGSLLHWVCYKRDIASEAKGIHHHLQSSRVDESVCSSPFFFLKTLS